MADEPKMSDCQRELAARYGMRRARPVELGWVLADDAPRPCAGRPGPERRRGRGTDCR